MKIKATKSYDYEQIKRTTCKEVDAAAELERRKYTTDGAIMNAVHQYKITEANHFLSLSESEQGSATFDDFPFLFADSFANGGNLKSTAEAIVEANRLWKQHMARIENVRRNTKTAIMLCENDITKISNLLKNLNFSVDVNFS